MTTGIKEKGISYFFFLVTDYSIKWAIERSRTHSSPRGWNSGTSRSFATADDIIWRLDVSLYAANDFAILFCFVCFNPPQQFRAFQSYRAAARRRLRSRGDHTLKLFSSPVCREKPHLVSINRSPMMGNRLEKGMQQQTKKKKIYTYILKSWWFSSQFAPSPWETLQPESENRAL